MVRATNLPPIAVTTADFDNLRLLSETSAQAAQFLAMEIERARLIEPEAAGSELVTMDARVRFRDDVTGQERTVTLVYPGEADIAAGRLSVLTPVGAALIGLSTGQSIVADGCSRRRSNAQEICVSGAQAVAHQRRESHER
jgi:regulator of nucleoside diphosphate kinase